MVRARLYGQGVSFALRGGAKEVQGKVVVIIRLECSTEGAPGAPPRCIVMGLPFPHEGPCCDTLMKGSVLPS